MGRGKKVLAAMSGGIDSSVAAALLKKRGYEIIGATMRLWPRELCDSNFRHRACCSVDDIEDARHVAAKLRIPHYVFDFSNEFKKEVIDYFCNEYAAGLTPNPCIRCNTKIKFSLLLKKARELGCNYISTGHYAKIGYNRFTRRYFIKEGADRKKDQSYFLFSVPQSSLSNIIFPLGNMTKVLSRNLAKKFALKVCDKKSSQEICFIEDHYASYVEKWGNKKFIDGDILDKKGNRIGRHKGIHLYTIGQRKGLGIPHSEPLYVIDINKEKNIVTVGAKKEILRKVIIVNEPCWGPFEDITTPLAVAAKIRYGHRKAQAVVEKISDSRLRVTFREPQEAPTPGQAAVFYKNSVVMGGGWIESVLE